MSTRQAVKYPDREPKVHELPPLPYARDALTPALSPEAVEFHYDKHHRAYVDKLNGLLEDAPEFAVKTLEEIVKETAGDAAHQPIFNQAAQAWNHAFFWRCMKPSGGGEPTGGLRERIDASFGGYAKFRAAFKAAATGQFGSGWAWLVEDNGKLSVLKTSNADTPIAKGKKKPLLVIDVWEHAYYIDFRNDRGAYVDAWLDKLVNWDFAEENLG